MSHKKDYVNFWTGFGGLVEVGLQQRTCSTLGHVFGLSAPCSPMPTDPAFNVYALSAAFVGVHMILLDAYSGIVRGRSKTTLNKEDKGNVVSEEPEAVARVLRAHRNLLVNAVPFLVLGLVMVLLGTTKTVALAYFGTFIVARVGHTVAYLAEKQPFRSIFFSIGQLAILGIVYQIVSSAVTGL